MASRACVLATIFCAFSASAARECIELTIPTEKHSIFNETFYNRTLFTLQGNGPHFVASGGRNIVELWDRFPKVVVPVNGTTEQCRRDSQLYLESLDRLEMWALKIFDSTAKLPSGILQGNGNQYGDFDQCLSVDGAVRGKYCLASLEVTLGGSEELDKVDFLVHSGHYLKSNLTDMGHRVPRFSSILWGVCIPSSCSSFDLEEELTSRLREFNIKVKVHNTMCSVKDTKRPYSFAKTLSITFFLAIILLLSLGTILDDGAEATTNFEKLLNAFSLKRNFRKLFDLSGGERLKGLDAIRGLNAIALLGAHKSMAMAHNNYVNKARLAEVFGMHWAVLGRSAILYTDSFLYLSGFLNAHNLLKELERKDTIDVKNKLVSRWFRLFPLFLSLMLFCTYILPDVNSGPQWNLVVEEHSRVCQKNMWKSFLFIHNWFGFEDMCLTHTHQIGIDIQLYVATIPLMLLLWKRKTLGWSAVVAIAVASTVLRYMAIYWHDISMVVYYGISVQKLLDAARFCYILPTHRATIYLIGVAMAYYFKHNKHTNKLTEVQAFFFWIVTLGFGLILLSWPYEMGLPTYEYSHGPSANFAAFSPILWGIFISVVHWGLANDYALFGTSFVNSRFFKFFNKIAYGIYLTQFPIFFYNVGIQRTAELYSPFHLFQLPETLCIFLISTLTTVAIEMPFNEVHRIYFGNAQVKVKNKEN